MNDLQYMNELQDLNGLLLRETAPLCPVQSGSLQEGPNDPSNGKVSLFGPVKVISWRTEPNDPAIGKVTLFGPVK